MAPPNAKFSTAHTRPRTESKLSLRHAPPRVNADCTEPSGAKRTAKATMGAVVDASRLKRNLPLRDE